VVIDPLISNIYTIDNASLAYQHLADGNASPLIVLLNYPKKKTTEKCITKIINPRASASVSERLNIAVIGAGEFAKAMHLPNIVALKNLFTLSAVVCRNGHHALAISQQFGARYASTDYTEILNDKTIDAVLISTRHHLHAQQVIDALQAKKHILVEKPLSLNKTELEQIIGFYSDGHVVAPILLTGFNRRFSPFLKKIKNMVVNRSNPMIINYRMNAGYISLDHWVHSDEGGGRNIGEACHIYDLFTFLTDSYVEEISAKAIRPKTGYYSRFDNFIVNLSFKDGSVANLVYTSLGNQTFPKEQMDIFVDGKVITLNNYKNLFVYGGQDKGIKSKIINKGQKEVLLAFGETIRRGGEWPIPLWQQIQAMEIAFSVEQQLNN